MERERTTWYDLHWWSVQIRSQSVSINFHLLSYKLLRYGVRSGVVTIHQISIAVQ